MSSNLPTPPQDPPTPPQDPVRKKIEELTGYMAWVLELIHSRNWFSLLLLFDAVLILFGTPGGVVAKFLEEFLSWKLPKNYPTFFWLIVGMVLVAALIVALRTKPQQKQIVDASERKAIKGLRPFSFNDAEIFARLQRGRIVQECLELVTNDSFRFGILMGESGCGKTSFLQAGLLPNLSSPEDSHRGIYIRFADRDPLDTIRKALVEQLQLPKEQLDRADFLTALSQGVAASKPLVLMFDQFEQFFVHFKQKQDREPFVTALAEWYRSPDPLPVKILVTIRGDLYDRLEELHRALGYSLGPQEVIPLEKFIPNEAAKILRAIAEIEQLKFDEGFVTELAAKELASREDGLVSAVDLQILAWTIDRQSADEIRAFDRQAFQKIGGVEGLLTRFLERTLEARVTPAQRQAAVKVLLALTDLDRHVRAGVLTVTDLQAKLKETVKPDELEEATTWLARGDVRLITPMDRDGTVGYELAHERIIPALMRLAGKELSQVDQANQLLDRRVNEWLGNHYSSRYLLTWRELRLIKQQKPYLIWGSNKTHKQRLLSKSKQRFDRWIRFIVTSLLAIVIAVSWLYSPWGQIWQVRREVAQLSMSVSDESAVSAAIAFAKDNDLAQALKISQDYISDPKSKAEALSAIAKVYGELKQPEKVALLQQAHDSAGKIDDSDDKAEALSALAKAYGELKQPEKATALLQQAHDSAGKIGNSDDKAEALSSIAKAYGELKQPEKAAALLQQALVSVGKIDDPFKAQALSSIVAAIGELKQPEKAAALLQQALVSVGKIDDPDSKAWALSLIAGAYGELKQPEKAAALLQQALVSAGKINDPDSKPWALSSIAEAYGELKQPEKAAALLQQALVSAGKIDKPDYSARVLSALAEAIGELKQPKEAAALLQQALVSAGKINDPDSKTEALSSIAGAYGELKQPKEAAALLQQARDSAGKINDPDSKTEALSSIAEAQAKLSRWNQAREVVKQCPSDVCKIESLAKILTIHAEQQNPALAETLSDSETF